MNPTNLNDYFKSQGKTLPAISERSGDATKAGISNYSGTAEQNNQLLNYYIKGTNQGSSPSTNTSVSSPYTINSSSLKQTNPVPLANPNVDAYSYTSQINNVANDLSNQVNLQQSEVDALREKARSGSNTVSNLQALLGGKTEDMNKTYQDTGVTALYGQLSDLNAQATGLKNEAAAIPIQIQNEFAGRGATEGGVAPISSARLRDNALKSLSLGQQAAIATANYDKAKVYADGLIEAKYSKITAEIEAAKTNLQNLKEFDLTPAENKLLKTQEMAQNAKLTAIQEQKDNEKSIQDLIIKAAGQGADQTTLKRASSAKSPQEAAIALGQWAGDYWQTKALEDAYKKQQVANTQTQVSSGNYVSAMEKYDATPAQLARAIAMKETNGGLNITAGASGELASKYQYMPATWASTSQAYNKAVNGKNAPLAFSLDLEDAVTEWQIAKWKAEGKTNAQIFAMWNGGPGAANNWQNRVGVNSKGVKYDVPSYVNGASQFLAQITGMTNAVGTSATNPNNTTAKSWLTQYNAGTMSLEDIYTKIGSSNDALPIKNELARLISEQGGKRIYGADDASIQAIQEQIKNINSLLQNNNYGSIVGRVQGGWGIVPDKLNTGKQDMLAVAKNLVSNQTLQALAEAKSKGITFGALSEGELSTLANSASSISSKIIKDKDGNVTGFTGSEDAFASDLRIIKEKMEKAIANKTNNSSIASGIVSTFESTLNNPTGSYIPKDAFVNSF